MDHWKRAAEVANIIGAAATLYVAYKAISDTPGAAVTPVTHPAGIQNYGLVVVGLTVACTCILNFIALRRQPHRVPYRPSQPIPSPSVPAQSIASAGQPTTSNDKITVDVSVDYLVGLCSGLTTLQAEQLTRPYIKKWMTASGIIEDLGQRSADEIGLLFEHSYLSVWFDKEWHDRLSVLKRGDRITIRGQIITVKINAVRLDHCEIIESHQSP